MNELSFGPVPSRRLGRSLGINNIPPKVCSYACIYCQAGRTTKLTATRESFYEPETLVSAVVDRLRRSDPPETDYLTFVPNGEPTLDSNLGREISMLRAASIPIAVITNGSLMNRESVRQAVSAADWVSLKIDAIDQEIWRSINRPHRSICLNEVLQGMRRFAADFQGTLVTETMLVSRSNDSEGSLRRTAAFIAGLRPARAYLSIPTRPPARSDVTAPSEKTLAYAYQVFAETVTNVEYLIGYEGNAFSATGDAVRDILGITAVHPMRERAVQELLKRNGASWDLVLELIAAGELSSIDFGPHRFYVRRLPR